MSFPFCNVALPVPLRTVFTYALPEALRGTVRPGSRVLVPFRKKSMVGVVVELAEHPPEGTKIREITKALDLVPALTPKLIELAHWIAGYYLAPVGEVFRAMLPPVTELRRKRLRYSQNSKRKKARCHPARRQSAVRTVGHWNGCGGTDSLRFSKPCSDAKPRRNASSPGRAKAPVTPPWRLPIPQPAATIPSLGSPLGPVRARL
jgi:primosomal protein N'